MYDYTQYVEDVRDLLNRVGPVGEDYVTQELYYKLVHVTTEVLVGLREYKEIPMKDIRIDVDVDRASGRRTYVA